MQNDNLFLAAKAAAAAVAGAFGAAFGWLGWLVLAWAACMALDYLTGSLAAARAGAWDSATARAGIWHKAGMIVVVLAAALCDSVAALMLRHLSAALPFDYGTLLLPMVLVWYVFTELGSVAENAVRLGAPVPTVLTAALKAGRQAADPAAGQEGGDDIAVGNTADPAAEPDGDPDGSDL